eukprot:3940897-Rhodomonas_salina.3
MRWSKQQTRSWQQTAAKGWGCQVEREKDHTEYTHLYHKNGLGLQVTDRQRLKQELCPPPTPSPEQHPPGSTEHRIENNVA